MKIEYAELEGIILGMSNASQGLHLTDVMTNAEHMYLSHGANRLLEILEGFGNTKPIGQLVGEIK